MTQFLFNCFTGMVPMPQPTVQYVQLGQEPSMAHPVMQYNGKIAFLFPKLKVVKLHKTFLDVARTSIIVL